MSDQHGSPKQEHTAAGPPAVWSQWPATLERAAWLRAANARASPLRSAWSLSAWKVLARWSARIEREPARAYGVGAAIAFVFGVLVGLL